MEQAPSGEDKLAAVVQHLDTTLQNHLAELTRIFRYDNADETLTRRHDVRTDIVLGERPQGEATTVHIRVVFLKVGEIDTIKENFSANVFIQANWREPSLDSYPPEAVDTIDWSKVWSPKLYVENVIGEPKETIWHTVNFDDRGRATAYEKRRLKGCFTENMELKAFPFDTQDLTVTVGSELLGNDIYLDEDRSEFSSINVQSFVDEQEWSLHGHVEVVRKTLSSEFDNIRRKPVISSSCKAKRRPGFFLWNILLVMLFICSLSFATFAVSIAKPQNRLQLSFTLVLTTIAFKFVASQSLPKISYLTYLDKYILTSMAILCSICVWHAIVPIIMLSNLSGAANATLSAVTLVNHDASSVPADSLQLALNLDKYVLITLGSIYIVFHIVFFLVIYVQAFLKQNKYEKKDVEHHERIASTEKYSLEMAAANAKTSKGKIMPLP